MSFFNSSQHNQTLHLDNVNPEQREKFNAFKKEELLELLRFTLVSLCIIIPIRVFIINPFIVSGASMFPTFHNNDFLIVDRISYQFTDPKRGEVVVFRYPLNHERFFIKRIIGLPGETVSRDSKGTLITSSNGKRSEYLSEPYIVKETEGVLPITLKVDEYYVMGDNRDESSDSRSWGVLPRNLITGKPLLRIFPLRDFGISPGDHSKEELGQEISQEGLPLSKTK